LRAGAALKLGDPAEGFCRAFSSARIPACSGTRRRTKAFARWWHRDRVAQTICLRAGAGGL